MTLEMEERLASFTGGFILSVIGSFNLIFGQIETVTADPVSFKLILTVVLGGIGGVVGGACHLLGRDLYTYIKSKTKKPSK